MHNSNGNNEWIKDHIKPKYELFSDNMFTFELKCKSRQTEQQKGLVNEKKINVVSEIGAFGFLCQYIMKKILECNVNICGFANIISFFACHHNLK